MKVKLKLNRDQYKGVATIAMNCCNALAGTTFPEVQYRDALWKLQTRIAAKVPTLKKKGNTLTLGEVESLALFEVMGDLVHGFQSYELGLGYWILAEIDRQKQEYVALMRANLTANLTINQQLQK